MKRRFDFDGALKELFERDRPLLLEKLTGGIAVKAFLNVELPKVQAHWRCWRAMGLIDCETLCEVLPLSRITRRRIV